MAGRVVRILPMQKFKFTQLQDGQSIEVLVARRIDASQYRSADLIVRVHNHTISADAQIKVMLGVDGYTSDDPTADFAALLASTTIDANALQSGNLFIVSKVDGLGPLLAVVLEGKQATSNPVTIELTISMDLCLKD